MTKSTKTKKQTQPPKPSTERAGSLTISYRWRCPSFPKGIPDQLWEALSKSAQDRATALLQEGYREGELNDYVNMTIPGKRTPPDGFHCTGWVTIETGEVETSEDYTQTLSAYEFDSYPNKKRKVEVREKGTNATLELVIVGAKHTEVLLTAFRDQWGVWLYTPEGCIAQEDETRSFLKALSLGLDKISRCFEINPLPPKTLMDDGNGDLQESQKKKTGKKTQFKTTTNKKRAC